MAIYGWVPLRDNHWMLDMMSRAPRIKLLPLADGSAPMSGCVEGKWQDIVAHDVIMIGAHGMNYTTESVGWTVNGEAKTWTVQILADALAACLGKQKTLALDYRLLACFGANNITLFAESFGKRLSVAMQVRAMKGTLTAYKGAVGILGNRGRQLGSSRITCALTRLRTDSTVNGKPTAESSKVWTL